MKPEEIEAVFCGTANQTGMQNDIARLGWLASGLPDSVPTNGVNQQCPSGMSCIEHACRAIMAGEGDIFIASGAEDMMNVPMAMGMDFPPRIAEYYDPAGLPMGPTAEKIADLYNISRADAELMAYHSHLKAAAARDAGKFANEIVPVKGLDDAGNEWMVDKDQWIRDNPSLEQMASMKPAFRPDGKVTAAISSPLTTGACAALFMSREKADELGLSYHLRYGGGVMAGCDPTVMGYGPVPATKSCWSARASPWTISTSGSSTRPSAPSPLRSSASWASENAPFDNINVWGGALALGHPGRVRLPHRHHPEQHHEDRFRGRQARHRHPLRRFRQQQRHPVGEGIVYSQPDERGRGLPPPLRRNTCLRRERAVSVPRVSWCRAGAHCLIYPVTDVRARIASIFCETTRLVDATRIKLESRRVVILKAWQARMEGAPEEDTDNRGREAACRGGGVQPRRKATKSR